MKQMKKFVTNNGITVFVFKLFHQYHLLFRVQYVYIGATHNKGVPAYTNGIREYLKVFDAKNQAQAYFDKVVGKFNTELVDADVKDEMYITDLAARLREQKRKENAARERAAEVEKKYGKCEPFVVKEQPTFGFVMGADGRITTGEV